MSDIQKILKWAGLAGKIIGGIVAISGAIYGMKKGTLDPEDGRKEIETIDDEIAKAIAAESAVFHSPNE